VAVVTTLVIGIGAASLARAQQRVTGGSLTAADYIEIQQLVARYGYAVDTHADNGYAYADLFAADGTFGKRKVARRWRSWRARRRRREADLPIRVTF
jgi:SnoaL-like protein